LVRIVTLRPADLTDDVLPSVCAVTGDTQNVRLHTVRLSRMPDWFIALSVVLLLLGRVNADATMAPRFGLALVLLNLIWWSAGFPQAKVRLPFSGRGWRRFWMHRVLWLAGVLVSAATLVVGGDNPSHGSWGPAWQDSSFFWGRSGWTRPPSV